MERIMVIFNSSLHLPIVEGRPRLRVLPSDRKNGQAPYLNPTALRCNRRQANEQRVQHEYAGPGEGRLELKL
jgi:hypothetical protein